jgi:hypothetical protein
MIDKGGLGGPMQGGRGGGRGGGREGGREGLPVLPPGAPQSSLPPTGAAAALAKTLTFLAVDHPYIVGSLVVVTVVAGPLPPPVLAVGEEGGSSGAAHTFAPFFLSKPGRAGIDGSAVTPGRYGGVHVRRLDEANGHLRGREGGRKEGREGEKGTTCRVAG